MENNFVERDGIVVSMSVWHTHYVYNILYNDASIRSLHAVATRPLCCLSVVWCRQIDQHVAQVRE